MKKIILSANSSRSNDIYDVTINLKENYLKIDCECEAAQRGRMCRHRLALITGETNKIYDESINNIEKIKMISDFLKNGGTLKSYKQYTKIKSLVDGAISQLLNSEVSQPALIEKIKKELDKIDKLHE